MIPRSNGSADGRRFLLLLRAIVLVAEDLAIHVLPFEELRLARLHDSNLLQHLLDDHANVLVVDLHALEAIDLLHFVEQILLHRARSLDPQNVVRIDRTFGQTITSAHAIAFVHAQVLAGADFVQLCLARLVERAVVIDRRDEDLALAALDLAEPHHAVDFGDRRRILRTTRFEQLGDSRQTARDVARLVRFTADLGDDRSREDLLSILHGELSARRDDEVTHALLLPALLLNDLDVRVELLFTIFDDDALTETGELIQLLGHRLVFDDVDEANRSVDVGENRVRVRVPGEDHLVALHVRSILDHEDGAERHLETRRDAGGLVGRRLDENLAFVRRDDALSFRDS